MAKYTLGDREFPRKGDAVNYVREILYGTAPGVRIDDPLIYALLDRHRRREEKVGRGLAGIEVVRSNDWGNRCFAVRTGDGGLIEFSFLECFKPSTPEQDAKAALSGIALTYIKGRPDTAEVDHAPPATFNVLAEQWALTQGGWTGVHNHQEGQRRRLTLDDQRADWQGYHCERATLRLLSAKAHRNVGAR
jgi:hypothetical protein